MALLTTPKRKNEHRQAQRIAEISDMIRQSATNYVVEWLNNSTIPHGFGTLEQYVANRSVAKIDENGNIAGTHTPYELYGYADKFEIDEFTFKVRRADNSLVIYAVARQ